MNKVNGIPELYLSNDGTFFLGTNEISYDTKRYRVSIKIDGVQYTKLVETILKEVYFDNIVKGQNRKYEIHYLDHDKYNINRGNLSIRSRITEYDIHFNKMDIDTYQTFLACIKSPHALKKAVQENKLARSEAKNIHPELRKYVYYDTVSIQW